MLSPEELKELPNSIVKLYQELEDEVIKDIARRIAKTGEITSTADWQTYMLVNMEQDLKDIQEKIARLNKTSQKEIEELYREAAERSMAFENEIAIKAGKRVVTLANSKVISQFLEANYKKTAGDLSNLTNSLGFSELVNGKMVFKDMARFYQEILNYTQFQLQSGAFDHNFVIKQAVKKMADSGLRTVDYASGYVSQLDVATRRAVLTGINQTVGQITLMQAEDVDCDIMELTAHHGARPEHAEWQGQLVSLSGIRGFLSLGDIGYGDVTGFKGANCRHDWNMFFFGISDRNWTDEKLKNIDPQPFEFEGKKYDAYGASQKQRQIEAAIRKTKRELIAYESAGLKGDFTASSVKLRRQKDLYRDFNKAGGLRSKNERHQAYGFGKSISQKGVWANKNIENKANSLYNLKNTRNNVDKVLAYEKQAFIQQKFDYIYRTTGKKEFIPQFAVFENNSVKSIYTGHEIRIAQTLVDKYGGSIADWSKKVGKIKSDQYEFDLHWYEKGSIQYELKLKNRKGRRI